MAVEATFTKIVDSLDRYLIYLKTFKLLRDLALNDPDEQLREWAAEQLKIQDKKLKVEELS